MKMELTTEQIKEYLEYFPETGKIIWKKTKNNRALKGTEAGCLEKSGYIRLRFNNKLFSAHRIAWFLYTGSFPTFHLDHINGIRNDNRISNLREATTYQNSQNRRNLKGYTWMPNRKKPWHAQLKNNGKMICLGYYETEEEAHAAYLEGKKKYHSFFVEESNG